MLQLIRIAASATLVVLAGTLAAGAQTTTVAAPPSAASPTPSPTPANAPENPLVTARITKEFLAWQRGRIDRTAYTPFAGGTYINAFVAQVSPDLQAAGAPQTTTYQTASLLLGDLVYRYLVTGTDGSVSVLCTLDQRGKIDGITFTPLIFRAAAAAQ